MVNEEVSNIKYDANRLAKALLKSGVEKNNLELYLKKASNAAEYYKFNKQVEGLEQFDQMATDILKRKYLAPNETGPIHMWDRVARAIAGVELTEEKKEKSYESFIAIMKDFKFIPGGRILHGAGREEVSRSPTLSNCYVIPQTWAYSHDKIAFIDRETQTTILDAYRDSKSYEEVISDLRKLGTHPDKEIAQLIHPADSLEGIYQFIMESGYIYRSSGGVGTDDSVLRPKGSSVNSTISSAPGQPSFMNLKSENTETVAQQDRRGALMITTRVDHPDIVKFIEIKSDDGRKYVKHANVSVKLTDEFMNAVEKDEYFTLKWERKDILSPKNGEITKREMKASELWDKIVTHAHSSAEPGIMFWDTMVKYHNGEYFEPLESTNPCGEQPLPAYGSCNLGNFNLGKYVINDSTTGTNKFDHINFGKDVKTAVRFMDNVIEYNMENHALERVKQAVRNDRRIGLGLTALGDAFVKLGLKYDSDEAISTMEDIMTTYRNAAYNASIELAKERGSFPKFNWDGYSKSKFVESLPEDIKNKIKHNGIRNVTLLTVAPVGTGSIIAQTSTGLEPIYDIKGFDRDVKDGDREEKKTYKVVPALIRENFDTTKELPTYVVSAHNINPEFRVRLQGRMQKYIDSSISSTINLPRETPKETIAHIYKLAWKEGLKGITVYREGSREGVLRSNSENKTDLGTIVQETKVEKIIPKHPALKEEPHSKTYSIKTGEGKLFVTITGTENGFPKKVFMNLGPLGTTKSTSAAVDGIRLSRYLEEVPDPDLIQIFTDYSSAKSDNPIGFGPNRVDSIHHGFSIAWLYDAMKRGIIEKENGLGMVQIGHKSESKNQIHKSEEPKILKENTESNLSCGKCGSRNVLPPSGGCREPVCTDCGHSTCG